MRNSSFSVLKLSTLAVSIGTATLATQLKADEVIFSENFASGINQFSQSGYVRLEGGSVQLLGSGIGRDGVITSNPINIAGFENLKLSFTSNYTDLDSGEYGVVAVSYDNSDFAIVDAQSSGSGNSNLILDEGPAGASTVQLRFYVDASFYNEAFSVGKLVLSGLAATDGPIEEPDDTPDTDGDRVTKIDLSASNSDGTPQEIKAMVSPSGAANKTLLWTVDDSTIASISQQGILTPRQEGRVTVTAAATDGSGVVGTAEVTIRLQGEVVNSEAAIQRAISAATAGKTIYVRGGTYYFDTTISLGNSGRRDAKINLRAYPFDTTRPKFDFSAMREGSSNRGLSLSGNFWHIYGIDVFKAGDNCMNVSGNDNVIEYSTFSECADTGLQLGNGASNNLILNSDSYFNADSSLENADGFAAKLDVGTGNKFVGCRAWNNLDDGWDGYMRGADNVTTSYDNCWAIDNGKLKGGAVGAGDGNGFKTGGSDGKNLKHNAVYRQCIAVGNVYDGFDHNGNRGSVTILNSAAVNNGRNINFSNSNAAAALTVKNTISFSGKNSDAYFASRTDIANNSWQNGLTANNSDFVSVNSALLKAPRKSDGSLPDVDFLKLQPGSDLIDAGRDVGLLFNGRNPDLGPFESK